MVNKQEGVQLGRSAFLSAFIVLVGLFMVTGLMLYVVPGADATWIWVLSPILVLGSDSGFLVIAIILFLMIISGALHMLKAVGLIGYVINEIVTRFQSKEFLLLAFISLFFMAMGAFVGIFEEVVPLVPLVILLARGMGWDDLTGLGMSVLACGLGFAAAVANPFTLGVAQEIAGLPIFSGALLRLAVFVSVYAVFISFLWWYASRNRSIDLAIGESSLNPLEVSVVPRRAVLFFIGAMSFMGLFIILSPFSVVLRDLSLPMIALIFLIAGIGVGLMANQKFTWVLKTYLKGSLEMTPAIVLILFATGIKHIMVEGQLLNVILAWVEGSIGMFSPFNALLMTFGVVMALNFFIGSGSAKAFILMPILMPTMDLLGLSRQIGILAFQFGDGFSNVMYPTNAVLLIALGLSGVSYGKWLRFILPLQVVLIALSVGWLAVAYSIGYGL